MSKLNNAYALLIGVGNDLPVTVRDAMAISNILADENLAGYPPENITLLTEKKATRKGILKALKDLIKKIDEDSSVMLFYSGHGGFYEPWNQFYLVPNNFDPDNYKETWVKAEELKELIAKMNSRRLVFFLDCCHAAGMTKSGPSIGVAKSETRLNNQEGLAQKIDDGKGMSIVSSCREDQLSYIMDGDSNSLYTKCLIEVLKGKHKRHFYEPFIRISEVIQYIFKKVPERNSAQNPYANLQIYDDFVLSSIPENLIGEIEQPIEESSVEANKGIKEEVVTVFRETENANSVLIFIHGFTGEASNTFGEIPKFLAKDKEMNGWDMFPLGYSENVKPALGKQIWASVDDINRISDYLSTSIKNKFGKYNRVAIVAHSLGGLVAQRALLNLDQKNRERISHLILFGTPSNGIDSSSKSSLWKKRLKDLSSDEPFIQNLRSEWNAQFKDQYDFDFKVVSATEDQFVTTDSSLEPFNSKYYVTVAGDHFTMVHSKDQNNDSYKLIVDSLTNNTFHNEFTNEEEINIVMGEYDAVVKKLLPNVDELDMRGIKRLILALEGLDRGDEVMKILLNHPLAMDNSHLLGLLGGRYKRRYLESELGKDGEESIKFYKKGLEIAEGKKDIEQIYYHSVNLAFLSLVILEDTGEMREYANKALDATKEDPINSIWKLATIAEANLYLADFDTAKEYYKKAADMAGIREKISIHINAYNAYTTRMGTSNPEDDFIKFLKSNFLS